MRIYILLIIFVILSGIIVFTLRSNHHKTMNVSFETIEYTVDNKKLHLYVADTEEKRAQGLMYYRSLDNADGMLFKFSEKGFQRFWNKNTFINLDIYWINDNKVVGKSILPSIEKSKQIITIESPEAVNEVIEIPSK